MNTCVARPTGQKVVESAREEAEVHKTTPRGHLMSHQVKDSDVKVNEVKPAANKMTVEDGGYNVISDGSHEAKECFSDTEYNSVANTVDDEPYDPLLADGWSQLRFVDVHIDGLPYEVSALNDSGCQLCVVKAEVVKSLNLPKLGDARLRGLSAEVVPAEIVRVRMKMAQGKAAKDFQMLLVP